MKIPITLEVELNEFAEPGKRVFYRARLIATWPSDDEVFSPTEQIGPQSDPHYRADNAVRQALSVLNPQKLVPT